MGPLVVTLVLVTGACAAPGSDTADDAPPPVRTESPDFGGTNAPVDEIPDRITGYGDFSAFRYHEVDWIQVVRAIVECARDQGMPVEPIPPGDGISFDAVPLEQNELATKIVDACEAGLNLPTYEEPTRDQIARRYEDLLRLKACLEREGYEISDAPTLDSFVDGYGSTRDGSWNPYDDLLFTVPYREWLRLNVACPQQ